MPLWKGGIDATTLTRVVLTVVASCVPGAGPALALAVNAAFIALDVADGTTDLAQGGIQMGVAVVAAVASYYTGGIGGELTNAAFSNAVSMSGAMAVNTFAAGIQYGEGGQIGWSWKAVGRAAKGNLMRMAVSSALAGAGSLTGAAADAGKTNWYSHTSSGLTQGFMSGYSTKGNVWDFKWDTDNATEHLTSGLAAGLSSWASSAIRDSSRDESTAYRSAARRTTSQRSEQSITGRDDAGITKQYALGDLVSGTEHMGMITSGAIHNGLMTGMYHAIGGKGFKNDYTDFNWKSLEFSSQDLGSALGDMLAEGIHAKDLGKSTAEGIGNVAQSIGGFFSDIGESLINMFEYGEFATDGEINDKITRSLRSNSTNSSNISMVAGEGFNLRNVLAGKGGAIAEILIKLGKSQRDNQAITPGAQNNNMCNPTSYADALMDHGVGLDDGKEVLQSILRTAQEDNDKGVLSRWNVVKSIYKQKTNEELTIGKINQLEDTLDVIRYLNNYGPRTHVESMIKTVQHFRQIEAMTPTKNKGGATVDWRYADGTSVLNRAQHPKKSEYDSPMHRNWVKNADDCKNYYMTVKENMKSRDTMILTTALTSSGHVTKLFKIYDDGVIVNDPLGLYTHTKSGGYYKSGNFNTGRYATQQKHTWEQIYKGHIGVLRTDKPGWKSNNVIIRRKANIIERIFGL